MLYQLQNDLMTACISRTGSELRSLTDRTGTEYIWQGDAAYWPEHAPLLFPVCGRLPAGRYTYHGQTYCLPIHGFLSSRTMQPVQISRESLTLRLDADEETLSAYPFRFSLSVTSSLSGTSFIQSISVTNTGSSDMPFAVGFHPGFRVPLRNGASFEEAQLHFPLCTTAPEKMIISPNGLFDGETPAPDAAKGLRFTDRSLFADSAFYRGLGDRAVLTYTPDGDTVTLDCPGAFYWGFWQAKAPDTPYLCLEPWFGSPSREGQSPAMETKPDMTWLAPGDSRTYTLTITVNASAGAGGETH